MLTIKSLERELIPQLFAPAREARTAHVESESGSLFLSQYPEEHPEWYADAAFTELGMPLFSHGSGSRVTAKRAVNDELRDMLNAQAELTFNPHPDPQ